MNREETKALLEKLAGQMAPFDDAPTDLAVLVGEKSPLGYSQLNELLLLFGFDRVSHAFFRYLLDGETDYETGQAFTSEQQLKDGIDRFRKLAILLYGNIKFAFKSLSTNASLLVEGIESDRPVSMESFSTRHAPVIPIQQINADEAYLTGYLIERELKARLEKNPHEQEAMNLEKRRLSIVEQAKANQLAYLASDHLDVYVATSMRERHEFSAISRLTAAIFQDAALVGLKLRWFDPTQAYCANRIDKGLSEALMLRRASCTIYLAQESDTLGKDSELASTLAQGKPVVAYIPEVSGDYFSEHLKGVLGANSGKSEPECLLQQLKIYQPDAAWSDSDIREWCEDPAKADTNALRNRLQLSMKVHYDKRADTLCKAHPLGIQVNLQTGVANGVLVVRSVPDCAEVIRRILVRELKFTLVDNPNFIELRETISDCIFRVVTGDAMLTNTFWNFYIDPTE